LYASFGRELFCDAFGGRGTELLPECGAELVFAALLVFAGRSLACGRGTELLKLFGRVDAPEALGGRGTEFAALAFAAGVTFAFGCAAGAWYGAPAALACTTPEPLNTAGFAVAAIGGRP
jgi:hypothetical protein